MAGREFDDRTRRKRKLGGCARIAARAVQRRCVREIASRCDQRPTFGAGQIHVGFGRTARSGRLDPGLVDHDQSLCGCARRGEE